MPWDELPARLKSTREGRGLSLHALSRELDIPPSILLRYERGCRTNNVTRWARLTSWIESNLPEGGVARSEGPEGCVDDVLVAIERDSVLTGSQKAALQTLMHVAYSTMRGLQR
jgi:hypothetical protein